MRLFDIFEWKSRSRPCHDSENLGLGLKAGDEHYRAYVGPPDSYDLVAAMSFCLLIAMGLRQNHRLLDIGCGSLRIGRLLIPYLNKRGYTGVEPNKWLVDEGVKRETGRDVLKVKRPTFIFSDNPEEIPGINPGYDFAIAQSIFSHTGLDLLQSWLSCIADRLAENGILLATFKSGEDTKASGWVYPHCVTYSASYLAAIASRHGLQFKVLDWRHPRQTWAVFARKNYSLDWIDDIGLSWNSRLLLETDKTAFNKLLVKS